MTQHPKREIYISLLEEGSPVARPTQAEEFGNGIYRVLTPVEGYNPEDEVWEFPPGSIVKCKMVESAFGTTMLLAVEKASISTL